MGESSLRSRRAVARGVIGTPKSGKSREIPLNDEVLAALKRLPHETAEQVDELLIRLPRLGAEAGGAARYGGR